MGRKHTHKVTVHIYTTKKMLNSQCAALLLSFYYVQRTVVCCPHIFEWVHYYLLHDEHVVVVVFFTLTDRASTIPSNIRGCQSGTCSQRGTKVNGSHHSDNPLLRPTRIKIVKKSYAALQAMAPTNIKTAHQTSLLHIESNLDRLGMLSPTHDQRSQQKSGTITLQPVLSTSSPSFSRPHIVQK